MYSIRPFKNTDAPGIAEVWNRQLPQRALLQPMASRLLEELVFAKPYFDPQGLLVAARDDRIAGFVHAGFGPNDEQSALSTDLGVTCQLMVDPAEAESTLAADLLSASESYLRGQGAKVLYAGSVRPLNPFYLGLYGGSELPGVLDSDSAHQRFFGQHGYHEIDRVIVLQGDLQTMRTPVSRQLRELRRRLQVTMSYQPQSQSWWDACVFSVLDYVSFEVSPRDSGAPLARASAWPIEPLASQWGRRAGGIFDVEVDESHRREGLATCLLTEVFRTFREQGIRLVEAQTMVHNQAALGLYEKLGFHEVDQGAVLRKEG